MAREGRRKSGVANRPRNQQHATPPKSPSGMETKKRDHMPNWLY